MKNVRRLLLISCFLVTILWIIPCSAFAADDDPGEGPVTDGSESVPVITWGPDNDSQLKTDDGSPHPVLDIPMIYFWYDESDHEWMPFDEGACWYLLDQMNGTYDPETFSGKVKITSSDPKVISFKEAETWEDLQSVEEQSCYTTTEEYDSEDDAGYIYLLLYPKKAGRATITVEAASGALFTFDVDATYDCRLAQSEYKLTGEYSDYDIDEDMIIYLTRSEGDWEWDEDEDEGVYFDPKVKPVVEDPSIVSICPFEDPDDGFIASMGIIPKGVGTTTVTLTDVAGNQHSARITVDEKFLNGFRYRDFIEDWVYPYEWYYTDDKYFVLLAEMQDYNKDTKELIEEGGFPYAKITRSDLSKIVLKIDGVKYKNPTIVKTKIDGGSCYLLKFKVPSQVWGSKLKITWGISPIWRTESEQILVKKYFKAKCKIKKSVVYNKKAQKPKVKVRLTDASGKTITLARKEYSVHYTHNKKVGTATVTILPKDKSKYDFWFSKVVTFKIRPKGTAIRSLSARSHSAAVRWKKQSVQTTGYQVQYSQNRSFKKARTITIKKKSRTKATIRNLKKHRSYFVRVRTYKTVSGKKYYSSWSKKRSFRTR